MPIPVIMDVDPGHDDAFAILLARADPRIDLLAITTVAGNQTLDKCTLNARRICTLAGIDDVPVAAGAAEPMVRDLRVAADVHGDSGLDGPTFPAPTVETDPRTAVELMRDVIIEQDRQVTLVPTGPLTNVALLLLTYPHVRQYIDEVVLMGGSSGRGNTTPYTEFNITVDPEAADVVFRSGLPVTMVGLNATHQAIATASVVERLTELSTPLAATCTELLTFYSSAYQDHWGFSAPPVHDPVAIARVVDPSLVRCVDAPVLIEKHGEYTAGATVVDFHRRTGYPDNARVAVEVDTGRFWDLMISAVASYD